MLGLQQGNAVLKQIHKEINPQSVERLLEETAEAQTYQRVRILHSCSSCLPGSNPPADTKDECKLAFPSKSTRCWQLKLQQNKKMPYSPNSKRSNAKQASGSTSHKRQSCCHQHHQPNPSGSNRSKRQLPKVNQQNQGSKRDMLSLHKSGIRQDVRFCFANRVHIALLSSASHCFWSHIE